LIGDRTTLEACVILRQFLHTDPVAISYLFGCGGKACAAVVDPVDDVGAYLDVAHATGMKIWYVIDSHIHADHVSTGRSLAQAARAEYVLFASAEARSGFRAVRDGEVLPLGNVTVEVPHTPVHTPEHICLLVAAMNAEQGARSLFRSLRRLKTLPDCIEVLPRAYAGSICGRGLSAKPASTIGFEKRHNVAFGIADEATFVASMLADIPPPPRARELRNSNAGWTVSQRDGRTRSLV
jgi:hydroxyacylglutathione hydrolase